MYRETASTTDREQASSRGRHGLCLCGRKVTGISRPDGLTSRAVWLTRASDERVQSGPAAAERGGDAPLVLSVPGGHSAKQPRSYR